CALGAFPRPRKGLGNSATEPAPGASTAPWLGQLRAVDLLREVTRRPVPRGDLTQQRLFARADVLRHEAAGMEAAAARRAGRGGHVALEHDPLAAAVGIRHWDRREQ